MSFQLKIPIFFKKRQRKLLKIKTIKNIIIKEMKVFFKARQLCLKTHSNNNNTFKKSCKNYVPSKIIKVIRFIPSKLIYLIRFIPSSKWGHKYKLCTSPNFCRISVSLMTMRTILKVWNIISISSMIKNSLKNSLRNWGVKTNLNSK